MTVILPITSPVASPAAFLRPLTLPTPLPPPTITLAPSREELKPTPAPLPVVKPAIQPPPQPKGPLTPFQREAATSTDVCNCYSYVHAFYPGVNTRDGFARTYPINSAVPTVGAVVVLNDSWEGHVALTSSIADGYITVSENNYVHCRHTVGRRIKIGSREIKGFYR